jgi:hypothetical protein
VPPLLLCTQAAGVLVTSPLNAWLLWRGEQRCKAARSFLLLSCLDSDSCRRRCCCCCHVRRGLLLLLLLLLLPPTQQPPARQAHHTPALTASSRL